MLKKEQKITTPGLLKINYFCGKSEKYISQLNPGVKNKSAFTLVELIIIITILAILGTIAYISFQGYTKDARDGIRMSDIKQIYNGLSIYKTQTEKTLLPDNYINIQSGTTTISYQGYAGANVLRTLKISGGKDPGTKDYYIYTTDVNTKKAQLMTYMETSDKDIQYLSKLFTNQVNALTNSGYYQDKKIYVYGDKIGILTNNKVPLQETTSNTGIDITTLTGAITTYFGGNVYSGGLSTSTGITLVNQINGAITGKLPCNGTTYNGYTITSLQDSQSGSFTKVINNSPLIQTGSIVATCNNGTLNYSSELTQTSCNSPYEVSGNSCVLNNYFEGSGISGDPYRIRGIGATDTTTIATSCNYYNLNATTNTGGFLRGNGSCGNGSQGCLNNGIYLIDPDGNGGNNVLQVYCDMTSNGGGWTTLVGNQLYSDGNFPFLSGTGGVSISYSNGQYYSAQGNSYPTGACRNPSPWISFDIKIPISAIKFSADYKWYNSQPNYYWWWNYQTPYVETNYVNLYNTYGGTNSASISNTMSTGSLSQRTSIQFSSSSCQYVNAPNYLRLTSLTVK